MKFNNKFFDRFFSAYVKFGFGYMAFFGFLLLLFILLIGGLMLYSFFYSFFESLFF